MTAISETMARILDERITLPDELVDDLKTPFIMQCLEAIEAQAFDAIAPEGLLDSLFNGQLDRIQASARLTIFAYGVLLGSEHALRSRTLTDLLEEVTHGDAGDTFHAG